MGSEGDIVNGDHHWHTPNQRSAVAGSKQDVGIGHQPRKYRLLPERSLAETGDDGYRKVGQRVIVKGRRRTQHVLMSGRAGQFVPGSKDVPQIATHSRGPADQLARVDGDPHRDSFRRATASRYARFRRRAVASHVNDLARVNPARPCAAAHASSRTLRSIASANPFTSAGSSSVPPSPTTSGREPRFETMTGTPADIASRAGIPNPSSSDGISSARAPAYKRSRSPSAT